MYRKTKSRRPAHVSVATRKDESPERLIRRFLRKVKKSHIIEEFREKRFFEKPSVKRRRKRQQRERTLKKLEEKKKK